MVSINTIQYAKKLLCSSIELKLRHNTVYSNNQYIDYLLYTATSNNFAEGQSKMLNLSSNAPSSDSMLRHIAKFERKEIRQMFDSFFYRLSTETKEQLLRRPLDLAIDFHDEMYYGDKNDYMVLETKPIRGTTHCYRFASINVVISGLRFILCALPVHKFDQKNYIVAELINYARTKVHINRVYLDRGFFSVKVISMLKNLNVKFLMPAVKNRLIGKLVEQYRAPTVINYLFGKAKGSIKTLIKLAIVNSNKNKKDKVVFATNLDISALNAQTLCDLYSRRWGIETSYRCLRDFKAKTTSKNFIVRYFYFMFAIALYNLWIFIGVVSISIPFEAKNTLTAKIFGEIIRLRGDYG